jgi:hypothetical protein
MLTNIDLEKDLLDTILGNTILQTKVKSMFSMQNELNVLIDPTWFSEMNKENEWDFQRAIMIELGELMDHYGYKWWKGHNPNVDQCQLEVIDIAHFYLSHLMQKSLLEGNSAYFYAEQFSQELKTVEVDRSPKEVRRFLDYCISQAAIKAFDIDDFNILLNVFNITADELCDKYIVKNTLNIFRAKNGYKAGTYQKIWNGREDNEVLMDCYNALKGSPHLADELYTLLMNAYENITDQKAA